MALPKPSSQMDWTDGSPAKAVEPSSGKKALGWVALERPPFEYMNWLFFNTDEWVKYLESATDDTLATTTFPYQAYVGAGSGCTHATLAAALADAGIVPGDRILVLDSATIGTAIQITKNQIEIHFHSRVTYTKGAAVTGIQISADQVTIKGGRFVGYTGGGDNAMLIDAGSDYSIIRDARFGAGSNNDGINDLASTSSILGTLVE